MSDRNRKAQSAAVPIATPQATKLLIVAVFVVGAFLLSYNYALAQNDGYSTISDTSGLAQAVGGGCCGGGGSAAGGGSDAGGGGCCGGGGPAIEGSTTVEGDVQRIAVDASTGSFNPNVIKAQAGVPIEIDFSQAPGGCLAGVIFPDFGIGEDLTVGGKTIELPALEPGEYPFFCQMQMVSATIVVE